jgi:hypothetical protein
MWGGLPSPRGSPGTRSSCEQLHISPSHRPRMGRPDIAEAGAFAEAGVGGRAKPDQGVGLRVRGPIGANLRRCSYRGLATRLSPPQHVVAIICARPLSKRLWVRGPAPHLVRLRSPDDLRAAIAVTGPREQLHICPVPRPSLGSAVPGAQPISANRTGRRSSYDLRAAIPITTGMRPSIPVTGAGASSSTARTKDCISLAKLSV